MANSLPPVLVIETTSRCNMRCLMCPQDKQIETGDITISLISLLNKQITANVQYIQLYLLGEPTLHPDLIQIIRNIRLHTNAFLEISTNLSVFKHYSEWEVLLNSGINRVLCCIEGITPASHKALRMTGDYEIAVAAVKTMADIKIKQHLNVDLVVKNIGSIYNKEEQDQFAQLWNSVPGVSTMTSWMNTWAGSLSFLEKVGLKGGPNANADRRACAELWNKMVIRWNGKVVLCCHDWKSQHIVGDANVESLLNIWRGEDLFKARRNHITKHFIGICEKCKEWSIQEEYYVDYKLMKDQVINPS